MAWLQKPKQLALLLLGAGAVLAGWAGAHQHGVNAELSQQRFDVLARHVATEVAARMRLYDYGLRATRSAIVGADVHTITRALFQRNAASLARARELPAARGFGYIRRVSAAAEGEFLAAARKDDAPQLDIHPRATDGHERAIVQFLEPESAQAPALGLDIASDARLRTAAEAALARDEPTLSGPIDKADMVAPSIWLFLPVYAPGSWPTTPTQREVRAVGWVFSPLVAADVVRDIEGLDQLFALALLDGSKRAPEQLFASSRLAQGQADELTAHVPLSVLGRQWSVELRSCPRFLEELALRDPRGVTAIGLLLALMCAGLAYSYATSLQRAYEVHSEQARLARVVENASDAIVGKTLDGVITSWNKAAEHIFGYKAEEAIGHTIAELLVPEERLEEEREILTRLSRGEHVERIDTVRRRRDGSLVEVAVASSPILDGQGRILGVAKTITDITHKKIVERKLLELNATLEDQVRERTAQLASTRRDLENILDALPIMIGYWDKHQRLRFANRAYAAWFAAEPEALIGVELKELFGSRYPINLPYIVRALAGETITLDREVPDPATGAPKQIELHYLPDTVDGNVHGFYLIAHNVTEQMNTRVRLAAALRETDALFSVIHQHAIVSMTDSSGKITEVNDAFCKISGYTREELLGHDHRILSSHVHDRSLWAEMQRTLAGGQAWRHTICNRAKDGSLFWVDSIMAPFVDDRGQITKLVSIQFDITAAKRSELALRESESLQRGILAHAGSAIIATDPSGTITLWNRAAETLLGYLESEVVETATLAMIHDADELQARREELESQGAHPESPFQVLVGGLPSSKAHTHEWTCVRKDGSRVPVLLTLSTLLDPAGESLGYLCVAIDLSVRQQHERQLLELNRLLAERSSQAESANQAKSMSLANMSHEIRTPLNAVIGLTYLLEQSALSPMQRALVGKVKLASRSLLGVINNVLDLTKIEAGELQTEDAAFDLRLLLEQITGVLHVQATAKSLRLSLHVDIDVPYVVRGDGQHLQQILTNLLSNAIKFTERGEVSLTVSVTDRLGERLSLSFVVKDSGIGIDPSVQQRVFAPFTQADVSTTRRFGGTGLGLSIVKRLVTHMGGEIALQSQLGEGTELTVTLPFYLDHRVASGPARPLHMLVAGDDASSRDEAVGMGQALGWDTHAVANVDAAIECIRAQQHRAQAVEVLVVLCHASPEEGERALHALHESGLRERLPALVLVSANAEISAEASRSNINATLLYGELTTSSLFNAVQEAVATRTGSPPLQVLPAAEQDVQSALLGRHVLVVDDSEVNLEIAARMLGLAGASVTLATNGQQAVDILRERPTTFDAVVMDVQMPVLDGLAATRQIREQLQLTSLPIIALTAGALLSERQRATAAGVDDFISKPFEPQTLFRKLKARLSPTRSSAMPATQASATAPPPPADWPSVDGLDTATVCTNVGGNQVLLAHLLRKLFEQFADLELPLLASAQLDDLPALSARLHKLRGIAGTLGARALHERATTWELMLQQEARESLDGLAVDVARELARLHVAAGPLLAAPILSLPPLRDAASDRVSHTATRANIDRSELLELLKRQSFRALDVFGKLAPALEQELGPAQLDAVRRALDDLKYKVALRLLQRSEQDALLQKSSA